MKEFNLSKEPQAKNESESQVEIDRWIKSVAKEQKPSRLLLLNEIFRSAMKLAKESPGTLNLKIVSNSLKELRYSFKLFYPYRFHPKITIFGSARVPPKAPLYKLTKSFAEAAVKRNYMIVTGGGPGIMAAGNEGAKKHGFGLNIKLPVEQGANPFIDAKNRLVNYKYFFTRKLFLVKEASAFVFLPGGFGTFDEAFEVLTLLQTGKTSIIPVVFLEPKGYGYWQKLMKFVEKELLGRGFVSPSDKALYRVYNTAKQALDHFDHFYRVYHSMRFFPKKVVIRLKKPVSDAFLKKLTKEFAFLSMDGKFYQSAALPEEVNEPELKDLTRLVFAYEARDFGSLRRLIDFLNDKAV